jgi:hypothetical protein
MQTGEGVQPAPDNSHTGSGRLFRYVLPACQILLLAGLLRSALAPAAPAVALAVVVHPGVPQSALAARELAAIYTHAKRTWQDGTRIRPLHLEAGSPARVEFDRVVRDAGAQTAAGAAVAQADVVGLVAKLSGAIGYVPEDRVSREVRIVARIWGGKVVAP